MCGKGTKNGAGAGKIQKPLSDAVIPGTRRVVEIEIPIYAFSSRFSPVRSMRYEIGYWDLHGIASRRPSFM